MPATVAACACGDVDCAASQRAHLGSWDRSAGSVVVVQVVLKQPAGLAGARLNGLVLVAIGAALVPAVLVVVV